MKEFERIVQMDKEYLYFGLSSKGKLLRSGTDNRIHGKNLIDVKDQEGIYFEREMLKAINQPEGVYVTYHWPKEKDGEPLKKTSFCLYIPELDIIKSYYKDIEDYIFIVGYDGIAHVFGNPNLEGANVKSILDSKGQSIHEGLNKSFKIILL